MIVECPLIKVGERSARNNYFYSKEEIHNIIDIFKKKSSESPFFGIMGYRDDYNSLPVKDITHEVKSLYLNDRGFIEAEVKGIKNFSSGIFIEHMDPEQLILLPTFFGQFDENKKVKIIDILALDIIFKSQFGND